MKLNHFLLFLGVLYMWIYYFNGLSLLIFRLVTIIRWIYSLKSGLVLVATDRNKNLFNDCM